MIIKQIYKVPYYLGSAIKSEAMLEHIEREQAMKLGEAICASFPFTLKSSDEPDGTTLYEIENEVVVMRKDDLQSLLRKLGAMIQPDRQQEYKEIVKRTI